MHLVMLETNGNQRFVFTSPRQRENIGASYLLTMLAPWTLAAAQDLGIDATPVSVSSGKIILTVPDEPSARRLIGAVTRQVLALAPGMDVSGVFKEITSLTEDELRDIHVVANRYNLARPPAEARFAQIPYLVRADDSSLPAAPASRILGGMPPEERAYSLPSQVKRACSLKARNRLVAQARESTSFRHDDEFIERLAKSLKTLEDAFDPDPLTQGAGDAPGEDAATTRPAIDLSKIAVIHIDGNGVGGVMRKLADAKERVDATVFEEQVGCKRNDPDSLRRFLLNINERLQRAVEMAFAGAWADIARLAERDAEAAGRSYTAVPVVPVIVGGDDVTVITSGDYALPFAACYLGHYERKTGEDPLLRYLTPPEGSATGPMTAAAGVAVVRRNFPFHLAYNLAEKLVEGAKSVGKTTRPPCSTLGYHALFDTTVLDAAELLGAYKNFTARPFRVVDGLTSCNCAGCKENEEDGEKENKGKKKDSDAAPRTIPAHETWDETCQRVAAFKGLPGEDGEEREPFPHTRAARIRKLLSDAANRRTVLIGGKEKEPRDLAENEWESARRSLGRDIDAELGGIEAVFDLLELADLLPDSYLTEVRERLSGDRAAPPIPTSPTEATA